jgi:hypothetical protein
MKNANDEESLPHTSGVFIRMSINMKERLEAFAKATGRKMDYVCRNGIQTAISTDCRFGDFPTVPCRVNGEWWKIPEPLAIAIEEEMESAANCKGKK